MGYSMDDEPALAGALERQAELATVRRERDLAFDENVKLVEKLKIAREALTRVRARSAMCGYDSGDTETYEIADNALKQLV